MLYMSVTPVHCSRLHEGLEERGVPPNWSYPPEPGKTVLQCIRSFSVIPGGLRRQCLHHKFVEGVSLPPHRGGRWRKNRVSVLGSYFWMFVPLTGIFLLKPFPPPPPPPAVVSPPHHILLSETMCCMSAVSLETERSR